MVKAKTPIDEKFEKQEFDLFEALAAIDRKDYGYYDRLTEEQQKKFVPFMLTKWLSYVQSNNTQLTQFYVLSVNEYVNKYIFNEKLSLHPKLIFLAMCASSPDNGKQRRNWIPQIKERIAQCKDPASLKDIKDFYSKTYPNTDEKILSEVSELYVKHQNKKHYLAEKFPNLKHDEIELLANIVNDQDIENYETEYGNI
ncbi:MAG: hypothetical protein EB127_26675 [Alphaproteobacteria bacterium]|nr:hypothetical protein [Alphaproteobacteria bacterium]